jgi:hypothetical protein
VAQADPSYGGNCVSADDSAAAHAADFADAAHVTRTFYQMVGMAPSVLMRGEFAELPSPFDVRSERPDAQSLHAPAQ